MTKYGDCNIYGQPPKVGFWQKIKNSFSKMWAKTVFPEKIKNAKAEKQIRREIQTEAKQQALKEMKPKLIEQYKKKELDKLNKGSMLQKLADGLAPQQGDGINKNKYVDMMGGTPQNNNVGNMMSGPQRCGPQQPQQPQQQGSGPSSQKIADMMGGFGRQPQQPVYRQPLKLRTKKTKKKKQTRRPIRTITATTQKTAEQKIAEMLR